MQGPAHSRVARRPSRRCMTSRVTAGPLAATNATSARASTTAARASEERPDFPVLSIACMLSDSSLQERAPSTVLSTVDRPRARRGMQQGCGQSVSSTWCTALVQHVCQQPSSASARAWRNTVWQTAVRRDWIKDSLFALAAGAKCDCKEAQAAGCLRRLHRPTPLQAAEEQGRQGAAPAPRSRGTPLAANL